MLFDLLKIYKVIWDRSLCGVFYDRLSSYNVRYEGALEATAQLHITTLLFGTVSSLVLFNRPLFLRVTNHCSLKSEVVNIEIFIRSDSNSSMMFYD